MSTPAIEQLREIDISKQSRLLFLLRTADYPLLTLSALFLLGTIKELFFNPPPLEAAELAPGVTMIAVLSFCAITGYRRFGVIDHRGWLTHLIAFVFFLLIGIVLTASLILLILIAAKDHLPSDERVTSAFEGLPYSIWATIAAGYGMVCLLFLRMTKITAMGLRLHKLMSDLITQKHVGATHSIPMKRVDLSRGVMMALLGGALLTALLLPDRLIGGKLYRVFLPFLGTVILLKARGYFQATADSMLAADRREPILFLRSFEDDPAGPSFWLPFASLFDLSLETRLSNHFNRFAPFVALSSSKEIGPQVGAARQTLSDNDWQLKMLGWISEASLIVMYAGKSAWVTWELSKVIELNRVSKLIMLMPQLKGSRLGQITPRFELMKEVFTNTRWNKGLEEVHEFFSIRALIFGEDASVTVIRSRSYSRESYHLAALIAHYLISGKASEINAQSKVSTH